MLKKDCSKNIKIKIVVMHNVRGNRFNLSLRIMCETTF